ncbi:MAG: hypothetical protein NTW48_01410 [Chloroflexi bacterium]|jgi:hypothetical protein|nr:hypothetical protein [Chloroflexota bacterium]
MEKLGLIITLTPDKNKLNTTHFPVIAKRAALKQSKSETLGLLRFARNDK